MSWLMRGIRKIDRDTKKCRGSMLILVLVIMALLAALVFRSQSLAGARLASNASELDLVRLRTAMTDGIFAQMKVLSEDTSLLVDHPGEPWLAPVTSEDPAGVNVRIVTRDLSGRFDLNNLYVEIPDITVQPVSEIALNLFTECGDFGPAERVDALSDWIDPDDQGHFESSHYQFSEPIYGVANYWLNGWSDLLAVEGFDREYLRRHTISPNTAFKANFLDTFVILPEPRSRPIPVNVNFAARAVLVGLIGQTDTSTVEALMNYRKENVIEDLEVFLLRLDEGKAKTLRQYMTTASSYFSIEASGYFQGTSARTRAMVKREASGKMKVMKWVL